MKKKIVLITGCSSGLGKALVKRLSEKEFIVYAGARNVNEVEAMNEFTHPVKVDITNDGQCREAVEKIIKEQGKIDVLINNAGYAVNGPSVSFEVQDFKKILDTNAVGAFRLIKVVYPFMKEKGGRIINITSLNGLVALPNFGLYSSSKFAFEALGLSLRYELAKDNIWVTNVAPGAIKKEDAEDIGHRTARQKFLILKLLMPYVSQETVVRKIEEVLESKNPPASVVVGADARIITFLKKILPVCLWDKLLFYIWSKK